MDLTTKEPNFPIMIIEDSFEDIEIMRYIFKSLNINIPFKHCYTVAESKNYLNNMPTSSLPKLILIDLNLPGSNGKEFLEWAKNDSLMCVIPVVVLSTSNNPKDIDWCYRNGANSYVIKPIDLDRLVKIVKTTIDFWLDVSILAYSS